MQVSFTHPQTCPKTSMHLAKASDILYKILMWRKVEKKISNFDPDRVALQGHNMTSLSLYFFLPS